MSKRPKAKQDKAKDVVTKQPTPPKLKSIDIPNGAKVEIARMTQNLDNYLNGVVAGLGIKGKWSFDARKMQLLVEVK